MKRVAKYIALAGIIGFGLVTSSAAHAAQNSPSCHKVVQALVSEWKASGYSDAINSNANTASGKSETEYLRGQIKQAQADCEAGYQQTALERANSVHAILDEKGISSETANAAMAPSVNNLNKNK